MGVSGAGKSTVAERLALGLDRAFVEGDSLHPPQNVEKMKHGIPLADADRIPWLNAIAARIDAARAAHEPVVDHLLGAQARLSRPADRRRDDVGFVYLKGSKELIARRLAIRPDHFMPPQLLDSQFAALEEPAPDEPAIAVPIDPAPEEIVE